MGILRAGLLLVLCEGNIWRNSYFHHSCSCSAFWRKRAGQNSAMVFVLNL